MIAPQRRGRFVLAPVVDGVADWPEGIDLVLAPIRLAAPVRVTLSARPRPVGGVPR